MFSLPTDINQLAASNNNMGEFNYRQLPPIRSATGGNFSTSEIRFMWQTSGMRWSDMKRSYLRMRLRLRNGNGSIVSDSSDMAFSMDPVACMFQSCEFRIADTTVSKVDNHVGQVSALKTRAQKSKAWLDGVGNSAVMMHPSFRERQQVSSRGALQRDESQYGYRTRANTFLGANIDEANDTVAFNAAGGTYTWVDAAGANLDLRLCDIKVGSKILINNTGAALTSTVTAVAQLILTVDANAMAPGNVNAAAGANNGIFDIRLLEEHQVDSRQAGALEVSWQPPLSVFDLNHALPAGRYELILTPRTGTTWQLAGLESALAAKLPRDDGAGPVGEAFLSVENIYLDLAEVQGPRIDDKVYMLDLLDVSVQKRNIADGTTNSEEEFGVPTSTVGLSLAFQDSRVGASTLFSPSKLRFGDHGELGLTRFYLDYANQKRPRVDATPLFRSSATAPEDYTVARYIDTIVQTGGYGNVGGAESIEDWHERGAYYHFSWPKEGADRSTRALVSFQFGAATANAALLLYSHYRKIARVSVEDGQVVEVRIENN